MKNKRGITLIALIITIIVMLILVAVTINVALNGGLFNSATDAKNKTQRAVSKEELFSAMVGAYDENGNFDKTKVGTLPSGAKWCRKQDETWEDTPNNIEPTGTGDWIITKENNKYFINSFGTVLDSEPEKPQLKTEYYTSENQDGTLTILGFKYGKVIDYGEAYVFIINILKNEFEDVEERLEWASGSQYSLTEEQREKVDEIMDRYYELMMDIEENMDTFTKICILPIPDVNDEEATFIDYETNEVIEDGEFIGPLDDFDGIPTKIDGKDVTKIGNYAFMNINISANYINDGIVEIGEGAFRDCEFSISTLTIPNSVKIIGEKAFYKVYSEDGDIAFVMNDSNENLESIGIEAFYDTENFVGTVNIRNSVSIGQNAFLSSGITVNNVE